MDKKSVIWTEEINWVGTWFSYKYLEAMLGNTQA